MPDTTNQLTVAIVEDDMILREEIGHFLLGQGYIVHELVSGTALDDVFQETSVDIAILDLNLPGESGFEIAQRYREQYPDLGLVILSARTSNIDRLSSYQKGADIYIPKPCPPDELLAAVRSLARRIKSVPSLEVWQLDPIRHQLFKPNSSSALQLVAVETRILQALARAARQQLSAEDLCAMAAQQGQLTEQSDILTRRALENRISRLRKKFSEFASTEPTIIRSIRSEGYQLCIPIMLLADEARPSP